MLVDVECSLCIVGCDDAAGHGMVMPPVYLPSGHDEGWQILEGAMLLQGRRKERKTSR